MSWFFGYYHSNQKIEERIRIPPALLPYCHIKKSRFAIYHDADSKLNYSEGSGKKGWLVSGYGINTKADTFTIISSEEWQKTKAGKPLSHSEGQYAAIEWEDDTVRITTDITGLRKIFHYHDKEKNTILFSTRLDILVSVLNECIINFEALGSFYSTIFSLRRNETFLHNIYSTGPASSLSLSPDSFQVENKKWVVNEGGREDIPRLLEQYLMAPHNSGYKTILALSGGLDSRTLLAIYLHNSIPGFSALCAGSANLPDLRAAQNICSRENIPLHAYQYNLSAIPDVYCFLREVSIRTAMAFKLENALLFEGLKTCDTRNAFLIDGAFGEFLRCMLGNKLLYFGKQRLIQNDATIFTDYLSRARPRFFSQEVVCQLNRGLLQDGHNVFRDMPLVTKKYLDYWVNLFIVRYRLGLENSGYVDSIVPNIMPFTQDKLLQAMFQTPRRSRDNNRINIAVINRNRPQLKKYPLIRDDRVVPFITCYNKKMSTAYMLLHKKLFKPFNDNIHIKMVLAMKDQLLSKISSRAVRECGYYDIGFLESVSHEIYKKGNTTHSFEILEFLKIDFWREHCNSKELIL